MDHKEVSGADKPTRPFVSPKPADENALYSEIRRLALARAAKTVRGDDAEDVAQEVTIRAFNLLSQDPPGLDLSEPLEPWVYSVVRHLIVDGWRTNATTVPPAIVYEESRASKATLDEDIERHLTTERQEAAARRAIAAMGPTRREIWHAVREEDLSHEEAAKRFGIEVSTVRKHLARANDAIRKALARLEEEGR